TSVPENRKVKIVMTEEYSWIVDGSNLNSLENANFPLLYDNSLNTAGLRGTVGERFSMEATNLPTSLELVFNKSNAGKFANLYKSVDGELVYVDTVKVGEDGAVVLPDVFEAGDYAVMLCEYSDRPGDADNDGELNAKDAAAILKHLVGIEECPNYDKADFNRDGFKDQKDAAAILRKIIDTP
ncbi:MAG: dockerin type I repeat-containing protein, partial [Oscillospiraceae bacterium]